MSSETALSSSWKPETVESHHDDVERVITEMHPNIQKGLSLNELADIALMTPFHFSRVFRCVTGVPPCRFMWMLRLEAAKELLVTTDRKVIEICHDVGYASLGTFTRRFTQLVGMSPLKFRNMVIGGALQRIWESMRRVPQVVNQSVLSAGLQGVVGCTEAFVGDILVGLFCNPVPCDSPVSCTLAKPDDSFRFQKIPDGNFFLFAAGIRETSDPLDSLLSDRIFRGAAKASVGNAQASHFSCMNCVTVRPPRLVDPPLLPCLPALFHRGINETEMKQHENQGSPSDSILTPGLCGEISLAGTEKTMQLYK